jgi:hypothetical protein
VFARCGGEIGDGQRRGVAEGGKHLTGHGRFSESVKF